MAICITVAPCGRDKPENGSKCCTAFLFPPLSALFFFFVFFPVPRRNVLGKAL